MIKKWTKVGAIVAGMIVVAAVLLMAGAPRPQPRAMAPTLPPGEFRGDDAQNALTHITAQVLVIPEGTQNLKLYGVQVPEPPQPGRLYIFTYTDGQHTVSLYQIPDGGISSFQPIDLVATSTSTVTIRGGQEAVYTEKTTATRKFNDLIWQEGNLGVALEIEEGANLAYLKELADSLEYLK